MVNHDCKYMRAVIKNGNISIINFFRTNVLTLVCNVLLPTPFFDFIRYNLRNFSQLYYIGITFFNDFFC